MDATLSTYSQKAESVQLLVASLLKEFFLFLATDRSV